MSASRILVVEDDDVLTAILRYNLEAEGYSVETCDRGDRADVILQHRRPDLLILDWMLPGLSGMEILRKLRTRVDARRTPVVIVTGRNAASERNRGIATGADDYIVKPFSVPKLLATVRHLLLTEPQDSLKPYSGTPC